MTAPFEPIADGSTITGESLILRRWSIEDLEALVALYNTPEMDRWTPIAHPFDHVQADAYLQRALARRDREMIQRAITEDGVTPLGEVLLFATASPGTCELGYAVDGRYRGRGLSLRAVRVMMQIAPTLGYSRARLRIGVGNGPSEAVARQAGFHLVDEEPVIESRKGYTLAIATWARPLAGEATVP